MPWEDQARTERAEFSYGCVRCQQRHYSDEPEYDAHRSWQDKHGDRRVTEGEWGQVLHRRWVRSLEGCHCVDCGDALTEANALRRPTSMDDVYELVCITCVVTR